LGSYNSRAGEPEQNGCVNSYLENETWNFAHPFVIGVSCFFKSLSGHPVPPSKYKLSDVKEYLCEALHDALRTREIEELLLEGLDTTEVDGILENVFDTLTSAVAHQHSLHVVKQEESSAKASSHKENREKPEHDHVNSDLHTGGFQVNFL
jgi:hypothetical protein